VRDPARRSAADHSRARCPDPFGERDATEMNTAPDADPVENVVEDTPVRSAKPRIGIPMWAVVGGVLLSVAGVVGLVASQMGKRPDEVVKEELIPYRRDDSSKGRLFAAYPTPFAAREGRWQ